MAKNCAFYDRTFLDDLYPYKYNSNKSKIDYYNGLESSEININNTIKFIQNNISNISSDIWYPVFITSANSPINHMPLYRGSTTLTDNLGIEEAIAIFSPQLQNWDLNDQPYMSTDWILTSDLCPFYPEYGLMFWFKYNSIKNKALSIDNIPIGSTVQIVSGPYNITVDNKTININNTTLLIKQDNNTLLLSDVNSVLQTPDQINILPSDQHRYIKISDILNAYKNIKKEDIKFIISNNDPIIKGVPELSLWIPDGDAYSYFKSPQMRLEAYQNKSCSSSYISPSLSNIYREIYHALSYFINTRNIVTVDNKKVPVPNLTPIKSKLFKKLCHLLSTYPLLDRTTISLLRSKEILSILLKYLNSKPTSVSNEIDILKFALFNITNIFNTLSTDYDTNSQTIYSHGLITTKTDLFNKLIAKYGSKLILNNKSQLKYKNGLRYGPHVKINQEITSKCDKSLVNQTVYNNISIKAGNFDIRTNFDNTSTKLILSNSLVSNTKYQIPLWDIEKTKLKNIRIPITAGPDLDINFGEQDVEFIKEIEYRFENAIIDYNSKYDTSILGAENPDILWRRVSGPDCIRFNSAQQPSLRYETTTDEAPTVFIKSPGKYVLEARVKTSLGVIYDTVTLYVNGKIIDKKNKTTIKSYNRKTEKERLRPASVQYIQAKNNLSIMVPNIRECYIGKQGVFWPSYTDCSVKIPQGIADKDAPLGPGNSLPPAVVPLGNNYHKFSMPMFFDKKNNKTIENSPCAFSITYNCNNTIVEINRITLTHLLDLNQDCAGCESLYEGIIDNAGFIVDGGSDNSSFLFMDPSDNNRIVNIDAPTTLTTKPFAVRSYGGFSKEQINQLGISLPYHPAPGSYLSNISTTGEFLDGPKDETNGKVTRLCHDTELILKSSIEFTKGCFHPYYGWTDNPQFKNMSSVVNFDPYNRAVQVFKGPGLFDLNNDFEDGQPKIYRSSITLKVDQEAYDPIDEENKALDELDKKEISDHIDHYGYRSIGGAVGLKSLNYNDEFILDFPIIDDAPVSSSEYCSDTILEEYNYDCTYTFTRPGSLIPFKDRVKPGSGQKRLRWRRYGGTSIGNIEVKLNFLNYVNPKNLVVWLEIDPCAFVEDKLNPPATEDGKPGTPKDPWFNDSYYDKYYSFASLPGENETSIENTKKFLYSLWNMNDNIPIIDSETEKPTMFKSNPKVPRNSIYRIYLLNQDHIENYDYNVNIKFSDLLDLAHNASNNNIDSTLYINNSISNKINNTIDLAPTLSAAGYDDAQVSRYKKIMAENKLYNNSHRFKKIAGIPIFAQSSTAKRKAGNSSETTFTLCVAVMDETDKFEPYDRVLSTQQITGFESCTTSNRSNIVDNSLCNWELIVHRSDESHGFIPGDSLGNIKYEDNNPSIPGYSFIADLTDKLHLLPPSVINAPNQYTIDGRLCRYSKESLNVPKFSQPLPLVITPLILILPTSLVGALASLPAAEMAMNEQTRQIVNYLNSIRQQQQRDIFNKDWYVPNYDKYPIGSSDKVLLSISKDNQLFYKTEASIFRYNNSVIMKKNNHQFYKLHYNSYLRNLSTFKISAITDNNFIDILYKNYIKSLYYQNDKINVFDKKGMIDEEKTLSLKSNLTEQEKDRLNKIRLNIKNVKEQLEQSDIIQEIGDNNRKNVIVVKDARKIESFKDLFYSDNYIKHNNIFDLSKNNNNFDTLINENKLYVIDGLRAYYFFENNRNIVKLLPKDPKDIDNEKINELQSRLQQLKESKTTDYEQYDEDEFKNIQNELFLISYNIVNNNIQNIGYIFDSNKYKTILILNKSPTGNIISVSPENSNRIVIIDNGTTIDRDAEFPLNIWSFSSPNFNNYTAQDVPTSVWGVGNYGYGSNVTSKYLLSQPEINSKIISFEDRVSYKENSTVDYNSFISELYYSKNKITTSGVTKSNAFIYTLDNTNNSPNQNNNRIYPEKTTQTLAEPFFSDINNSVYETQNKHGYITEIDVTFNENDLLSDKGMIAFNKDIRPVKTFKLDDNSNISILNERIIELDKIIKTKTQEANSASKQYSLVDNKIVSDKEKIINSLRELFFEKNNIQFYIDKLEESKTNINIIPNTYISINKNENGSLNILEKENSNLYWINIDPEQGCSIDKDRTPKILKKVKFECLPYDDVTSLNADTICVDGSLNPVTAGIDESFSDTGSFTEYQLTESLINNIKAQYPALSWPENNAANHIIERRFFLNFHGKERAQEVIGIYEYICPIGPSKPDIPADGNITNKIYNIFNLDETEKLYVDFKRIPRLLRNKDTQFDIYEPNNFGELTKSIMPSPGGPIDGSFRVWKCIDSKTGQYAPPHHPYYQWLNEMLFRTYFGSVDGAEHKGRQTIQSKDEGYWVPYDFS